MLSFDNRFVRALPEDPLAENKRRQVAGACYSRVNPKHFAQPYLIAYSDEVANLLNLPEEFCKSPAFVQTFAGNDLLPGMDPYATCYGGHQFGNWAGQLGDGRAINLGEITNNSGERWALQLKGAGPTPYSRTADGLAVLRSSVREFLCSEAMHHLGVPTTRALSVVGTGELVERDMLYDGNPRDEPGAVVCRVAQSFTRFGSFEIFTARGEIELLRQLTDYTIQVDYPHIYAECGGIVGKDEYLTWFDEICQRTAEMIVHWQRVGFVHGVMNTDNMSIMGLTIDYGPYGWLDNYDPDWTPNTTDAHGRRYRFGNQPQIALWNLVQLANAIYPLIEDTAPLEQALSDYKHKFDDLWHSMMASKLGWRNYENDTDQPLLEELDAVLRLVETDMTIFYRSLAKRSLSELDTKRWAPFEAALYSPETLGEAEKQRMSRWVENYILRSRRDDYSQSARQALMDSVNPKYVLRNYMAQLAIDKAEQGDYSLVCELLDLLRRPYDEQSGQEQYAARRPDWARSRAGCSMLSCSS